MTDEVDAVWEDAFGKYFLLAAEKLSKSCPKTENQIEFDCYLFKLRVHFLFPDLTDQEREVLYAMSCNHVPLQLCIGMLSAHGHRMTAEDVAGAEKSAREAERQFMEYKRVLYSRGVMDKLTPFQIQMLERHLFNIVFPEKHVSP